MSIIRHYDDFRNLKIYSITNPQWKIAEIATAKILYPWAYRTVYDCYKRIVKKIGAPKARFHDLRHTYAYMALSSGIDVKTVQYNLGHATPDFTLRVYAHVTAKMKEMGSERMERYIQDIPCSTAVFS